MFDVCTTGDTAHIDMILKFLPHKLTRVWQELHPCLSTFIYIYPWIMKTCYCLSLTDTWRL